MLSQISPGVKYIIQATLCFGIINLLVKYFNGIPAVEIVFFRSIVSFVLSGIIIKRKKLKVFNQYTPLLLMRGLTGAIALMLYFTTLQVMPLATSVTILYLAPIFTVIFAIFFVGQKPRLVQWPFIFSAFIGAYLLKEVDYNVEVKYFFMALVAAIFAALAYNFIRLLKGKADPNLIIFYFPLVTLPLCAPFVYQQWITPSLFELTGLIFIGVLTQFAQLFMTRAYLYSEAKEISHFNYLTSLYAVIAGHFIFDEVLSINTIAAISIIIISIVISTKLSK